MLHVVYEATTDLSADQIVDIAETRGRVTIKLRKGTLAHEYLSPLNAALEGFVGQCRWFQIWRGQIISASSPDSPLSVRYVADPEVNIRTGVQIREYRGVVRLHISPELPVELLILAVNPAIERFLAGGQWFQLWQGEIVTMDDPDSAAA